MIELNKEDQALHDIFHGEEKPMHPDTVHITLGGGSGKPSEARKNQHTANTTEPARKARNHAREADMEAVDSSWHPIKPSPDFMDRLKACVLWAGGFGGLNMLVFYWQQAELMDACIATPCMWVCMALFGIGIGKNAFGRVR